MGSLSSVSTVICFSRLLANLDLPQLALYMCFPIHFNDKCNTSFDNYSSLIPSAWPYFSALCFLDLLPRMKWQPFHIVSFLSPFSIVAWRHLRYSDSTVHILLLKFSIYVDFPSPCNSPLSILLVKYIVIRISNYRRGLDWWINLLTTYMS
jgi:hypothetical protein